MTGSGTTDPRDGVHPDVIVIGGGMAGVSAAYEIAGGADVLLLEAEGDLPIHTTGRSAAMLLPAYGNDVVRRLTAASVPDFARLQHDLGTPSLLAQRDVLYVADDDAVDAMPQVTDRPSVHEIAIRDALSRYPALRPGRVRASALDSTGSDIDVLALHQGYLRGLKRRGGAVVRGARVTSIDRVGSGWGVTAAGRTYHCADVVNAAGAWADQVAAQAGFPGIGLRSLRRSVCVAPVTAIPGFQRWPFLMDAAERFYAKPEGEGLLISPADESEHEPGDARPDELEIARALEQLRELTTFRLRTVRVQWAGLRTFATDNSPVVGEAAEGSGLWWFAGQGGYGIQFAPALARLLATFVLRRPVPSDLLELGLAAEALRPDRFLASQCSLSGLRGPVEAHPAVADMDGKSERHQLLFGTVTNRHPAEDRHP